MGNIIQNDQLNKNNLGQTILFKNGLANPLNTNNHLIMGLINIKIIILFPNLLKLENWKIPECLKIYTFEDVKNILLYLVFLDFGDFLYPIIKVLNFCDF